MTNDIPLVQFGFFAPVLDTLASADVAVDSILRRNGLHRFDLGVHENYVPVKLMYRLLEDIRRNECPEDFFAVFGTDIELKSLSEWGEAVAMAPDLLSACELALRFDRVVMTHERMRLTIDGPTSTISQYYLDRPQAGRDYADYVDFCYMLNGLKLAGGPRWEPLEIHLQSATAPDFDRLLPPGYRSRILLDQPMTSVVFPTELLSATMLGADLTERSDRFRALPSSLVQVIEELLDSSQNAATANLAIMAEMLDVSPRTLRRRLAEQDSSFFGLVDRWRFKTCLRLLRDERTNLGQIAERLGYANTPNFERAFRRWTGQAPGRYRDNL